MGEQPKSSILPDEYADLTDRDLTDRISMARQNLDSSLLILAHHYQRQEIVDQSDYRGDSFELARMAQGDSAARWVVFCGVRFMAESAAILASPGQQVIHPNSLAGCPLADMAKLSEVEEVWSCLEGILGSCDGRVVPVTYINSSAELKAFCGRHGGTICTSSNAAKAFEWSMETGEKVFFFPDQHLGRNTANAYGIPRNEIVLWQRGEPMGGLTAEKIDRARVILWDGFCHVHTWFTTEQIDEVRQEFDGVNVVVHPECPEPVVQAADANGSTSFIINYVREASPGSSVAVGTEINLVNRLARETPGKTVMPLSRSLCPNMYRINLHNLCWALEHPEDFTPVAVDAETSQSALVALERMLSLS